MKMAGLSIDMDSVASHLEGYGFERPPDDGAAYTTALPRILELLARHQARATFFLIAAEARGYPAAVAQIVDQGHEVASHSMTHCLPFHDLDPEALTREIQGSRSLLEDLAGREIIGFRAPSWDTGTGLMKQLVAAGYRYDSSAYPSILLPLLRASIARRGSRSGRRTGAPVWSAVRGPALPHRIETDAGVLVEIPMCTTPRLRLPYYHTLRFVVPDWVFREIRRRAHSRPGPCWYQFHAVDFMSLDTDHLDERIARHPGMDLPLEDKLDLAADAVQELGRDRTIVPLQELVWHRYDALEPSITLAHREAR